MLETNLVNHFYNTYNEEERLADKCGQVEFMTTMEYIHNYLKPGMRVLEIGAGTGRYSRALAKEGYRMDAVELVAHNIDLFRSKMDGEKIRLIQGNAVDLSMYGDETFDGTLSLGPMYHLFQEESRKRALEEAIRVTKKGGVIFVAYCMNEATILQYSFRKGTLLDDMEKGLISPDFHWKANENDAFALMRPAEIEALTEPYPVKRMGMAATDGASRYMEDVINAMSDDIFRHYYNYHLSTCERKDLIGASNHVLDILRKETL